MPYENTTVNLELRKAGTSRQRPVRQSESSRIKPWKDLAVSMRSVSKVPPNVFGVWLESPRAEEDNLLVNGSPPPGQSAGRRLVRPRRSRSPAFPVHDYGLAQDRE